MRFHLKRSINDLRIMIESMKEKIESRKINEKIESMKIKNDFRSLHRYSLQIFPILIVSQNICPKKRYVNVSSDISRLKTGKKRYKKVKKFMSHFT